MILCTRASRGQPHGDVLSDSNKTAFCFIPRIFPRKYPSLFEIQAAFSVQRPRPEKQLFSQEEKLDIRHLEQPGHGIMVTLGLGLGSESASRVLLCKDER